MSLPGRRSGLGSVSPPPGVFGNDPSSAPLSSASICPLPQQSLKLGRVLGLELCVLGEGALSVAHRELQGRVAGGMGLRGGPREGRRGSCPLFWRGNGNPRPLPLFSLGRLPTSSHPPLPLLSPMLLPSRATGWGRGGGRGWNDVPCLCHCLWRTVPCQKQMSVELSCGEYSPDLSHKNRKTAIRTTTAGARVGLSDGRAQSRKPPGAQMVEPEPVLGLGRARRESERARKLKERPGSPAH